MPLLTSGRHTALRTEPKRAITVANAAAEAAAVAAVAIVVSRALSLAVDGGSLQTESSPIKTNEPIRF